MARLNFLTRFGKIATTGQFYSITSGISKTDIIGELHERGVEFAMTQRKDALLHKLETELTGIHRLPALIFERPNANLLEYGLSRYEV